MSWTVQRMQSSGNLLAAIGCLLYSGGVTILENVSLAQYTTLGVGGAARWFVQTSVEAEILSAVRYARARGVPCFILGGGSNLLVSDEGFDGVVVRVAGCELEWAEAGDGTASITASAGAEWDAVVRAAVEKNGAGVECLAGIPGSVGGTPVQNVGAYGQEVSQTIIRVRALDLVAEKAVELAAAECGFGYRRSIFNTTERERYAITRVEYRLAIGGKPLLEYRDVKNFFAERGVVRPTLAETAAAVREIRARKGMLLVAGDADSHSAGSFFKNPVVRVEEVRRLAAIAGCRVADVPQFPAGWGFAPEDCVVKLSAAWLIELAGFGKGFAMGHAGLSTKHVLAIVNRGGATAGEIMALRDAVTEGVRARTGVWLEQEPVLLGFAG
jgi:UDP-N-acetylmuramate dehydrogenase